MLKAIHAQEDKEAASKKIGDVIEKLKDLKLNEAAGEVETAAFEPLSYMDFPREHWGISGWTVCFDAGLCQAHVFGTI